MGDDNRDDCNNHIALLVRHTDDLVYRLAMELVPKLSDLEKWYPSKMEIRRYLLHLEDVSEILICPHVISEGSSADTSDQICEYLEKLPIAVALVRHHLWGLCVQASASGGSTVDVLNEVNRNYVMSLDDIAKRTGLPLLEAKAALDRTAELFRKSSLLSGRVQIAVALNACKAPLPFLLVRE